MWNTPIGRVRAIALIEGVSFLVLLLVAMPLKYLADLPMAVKIVGWIHGGLFILLCGVVASTSRAIAWPHRESALVILAALVPLGPFLIDGRLKRDDEARQRDARRPGL